MGIEALSRGASSATFVEHDRNAASCIRENLSALQIEAAVIQADVDAAIKRFIKNKAHFDIIYIDPPYSLPIEPILEQIPQILSPEGIAILEQGKKAHVEAPQLQQLDRREYGDTTIYFYTLI